MKTYASGRVEIEEKSQMYGVYASQFKMEDLMLFTSKKEAEKELEYLNKGHEEIGVVYIRSGETVSDAWRKKV